MNQTIVHAIRNKIFLQIVYNGCTRVVEPHAYGVNKNGQEVIRLYEAAPAVPAESFLEWQLLALDEISPITMTEYVFSGPRLGYVFDDPAMLHIFAQL